MLTNRTLGKLEMPVRRKTTNHTKVRWMQLPQQHRRAPCDRNLTDKLQEEETESRVEQEDGRNGES